MIKFLYTSTFLLFLCTTVTAQPPTVVIGPSLTKPNHPVDVEMLGQTAEGVYVIHRKAPSGTQFSPTIVVEHLNAKQEKTFSRDITPAAIEDYVNVVYFDKVCWLIRGLFNKEEGKNTLSALSLSREGALGKPVPLATLPAEKLARRGRFEAAASPDGSKLLVLSLPEFVKDENEKITLTLFGSGFQKIWATEQTFAYPWTRAVENKPFINNQGTAFILKKTDMKGDDNTYSIFTATGGALKEHKIVLDGNKKIHTQVAAFTPDGKFTSGGYYTEDKKVRIGFGNPVHGAFLEQISADGATATIAAVNPFEKRKDIFAKGLEFNNQQVILLGEWTAVNSKAANKPGDPFARDYTYSGNDIIIDVFDGAGKPQFAATVKKSNESVNDNGTGVSYFYGVAKGKLYLLFNDDLHRYDGKKNVVVFGVKKIVVYATVDLNNGAVAETQPVPGTEPVGGKDAEMWLRPDVFIKAGENRFLIRAENPSKYRTGVFSF